MEATPALVLLRMTTRLDLGQRQSIFKQIYHLHPSWMTPTKLIYSYINIYRYVRCMCRSDSPVSRSVVIDDRTAVLILFRPLKDLSAEQLVTGRVHNILTKALILGNMVVACLRVTVGLRGRLLSPWSLQYCSHFICQQCSSLSIQVGDGRSSLYRSTSWLTLEL